MDPFEIRARIAKRTYDPQKLEYRYEAIAIGTPTITYGFRSATKFSFFVRVIIDAAGANVLEPVRTPIVLSWQTEEPYPVLDHAGPPTPDEITAIQAAAVRANVDARFEKDGLLWILHVGTPRGAVIVGLEPGMTWADALEEAGLA